MRVLVTGGTGFVGSHTARALVAAGHDVRLLVRDPAKAARVFGEAGEAAPECVRGDVTDESAVKDALAGCDAVFHAAGAVSMKAAHAAMVLDTNVRGAEVVLGSAHQRGLESIVYVSSVSAMHRPGGPPLTTDSPVIEGRDAYGRSKAEAERFARGLQAQGAPLHITYPTAVIGPDDPGLSESSHAVRTYLKVTMMMTSGGFQAVDARDLAIAHVRLLERRSGPGRYILGGHYLAWRDLADLIDSLTQRRVRRIPCPGSLLRFAGILGDLVKRVWDFDFPLTREGMGFATLWTPIDSGNALDALGIQFRDPAESYADTITWLTTAGHLRPRLAGRLAALSASAT